MKKLFLLLILTRLNAITIDEAISTAYKNRPSLKAFNYATETKKLAKTQALSGYLPQVNISGSLLSQKDVSGTRTSVLLEAKQLIYSFAGPIESYGIAKEDLEATKYSELAHKDLIRNEVEISYYQCWISQKRYNYIKALNKSSNDIFKQAHHENKLGLLDKKEWLESKSIFAIDNTTVNKYKNDHQIVLAELENKLGTKIDKLELNWQPKKQFKSSPLKEYITQAIRNRKELKIKDHQINKASKEKYLNLKKYLPEVHAQAATGRTKYVSSSYGVSNYPREVGLSFSWKIFDGLSNKLSSDIAQANKTSLIMEKSDLVQLIQKQVTQAYNELEQAIKDLKAQEARYLKSDNDLKLKEFEYKIGKASKVDLKLAKSNWEEAHLLWIIARTNVSIKESSLLFVCGYP